MTIEQERLTPTQEEIERLEELLSQGARESDSGWYIAGYTDDGLSIISDGLHSGMYRIAAEKPQAELIVEAINALPTLLAALKSPPIAGGEGDLSREQKTGLAEQVSAMVDKYREAPFRSIEWLGDNLAALMASITQPAEERVEPTTSGDVGKLCEGLRAAANGIGSFRSAQGDFGLCDDAADRIAALEKALEPSADTKAEYIGEVKETLTLRDEDGEEFSHQHTISWGATKDTMKMISAYADSLSARALLNPTPTEER